MKKKHILIAAAGCALVGIAIAVAKKVADDINGIKLDYFDDDCDDDGFIWVDLDEED